MSTLGREMAERSQQPNVEWGGCYGYREHDRDFRGGSLLVPGLALVGLGALLWWWIGPDVIRYMKIRNM